MIRLGAALALALATPALAERVPLDGFAIDRTEVTVGAFAAYLAEAGLETEAERQGGGFEWGAGWERRAGWTYAAPQGSQAAPDEPAVHVSWHEANAYYTAQGGRLPTRAEWASAAYTERRATPPEGFVTGETYTYPAGNDPEGMNNNREAHVAVGTTKQGVNGLYDRGAMPGNGSPTAKATTPSPLGEAGGTAPRRPAKAACNGNPPTSTPSMSASAVLTIIKTEQSRYTEGHGEAARQRFLTTFRASSDAEGALR